MINADWKSSDIAKYVVKTILGMRDDKHQEMSKGLNLSSVDETALVTVKKAGYIEALDDLIYYLTPEK